MMNLLHGVLEWLTLINWTPLLEVCGVWYLALVTQRAWKEQRKTNTLATERIDTHLAEAKRLAENERQMLISAISNWSEAVVVSRMNKMETLLGIHEDMIVDLEQYRRSNWPDRDESKPIGSLEGLTNADLLLKYMEKASRQRTEIQQELKNKKLRDGVLSEEKSEDEE